MNVTYIIKFILDAFKREREKLEARREKINQDPVGDFSTVYGVRNDSVPETDTGDVSSDKN